MYYMAYLRKEEIEMDTLEELEKEYTEACNMPTKPDFKKPEIGTVFDEEKSVRWNREEVERKRNLYDNQIRFLKGRKNDKIASIEKRIYKYITLNTGLNEHKAKHLFDFVYNAYHSTVYEMFIQLDEQIVLVHNLLN